MRHYYNARSYCKGCSKVLVWRYKLLQVATILQHNDALLQHCKATNHRYNKLPKNSYKEREELLWRPIVHEKILFTFMPLHSYVSVHPFFCFFVFFFLFCIYFCVALQRKQHTSSCCNYFLSFFYLDYDPFFLDGLSIPLHIVFFNKTLFLNTQKIVFVFVSLIVEKTTMNAQIIIIFFS
jgi:hypothetical protein